MRLCAVVIALAAAVVAPVGSQAPEPRAAGADTRLGRVVGSDGAPLRGVRVQLLGAESEATGPVYSDEEGRYVVTVRPGPVTTARFSKAGFVTSTREIPSSDAAPVVMTRGAAVNGRVADRFGDPAVRLGVYLAPLDSPGAAPEYVAETDDLGEFRIGGLSSGRYAIQLTGAKVVFDHDRLSVSIPYFERYLSTTSPHTFDVREAQEVRVDLTYGAGPDSVELGAVAVESARQEGRTVWASRPGETAAAVEGSVTDARGRAARGVMVDVDRIQGGAQSRTATDANGRYHFASVPAGTYVIYTRPDGFALDRREPVASRHTGQVIDVRPDRVVSVALTVIKGSAVGGAVTDGFGDAVAGAAVELRRVRYWNGRALAERQFDTLARLTDDRGRYRFPDVPAGDYFVVARRDHRELFYPGGASAVQALPLRIDSGRDRLDVDMRVPFESGARLFGQVEVEGASAGTGLSVVLMAAARGSSPVVHRRLAPVANGRFEFTSVAPGDYVLQVIDRSRQRHQMIGGVDTFSETGGLQPRRGPMAFGYQYVSVEGGETGPVLIAGTEGTSLTGRVVTAPPRSRPTRPVQVTLIPADVERSPFDDQPSFDSFLSSSQGGTRGRTNADGTFAVDGVTGTFRVAMSYPVNGWWLQSAIIDGVNAVEVPVTLTRGRTPPVEVVVAADAATLTGRITDERAAVVAPVVVVFPTDSARWFPGSQYVRQASAARNGTFTIHSLPPGDYWVVALDDLPPDPTLSNWQDASLLSELIARATRVQLDPSKRAAIELPLSSVYR